MCRKKCSACLKYNNTQPDDPISEYPRKINAHLIYLMHGRILLVNFNGVIILICMYIIKEL